MIQNVPQSDMEMSSNPDLSISKIPDAEQSKVRDIKNPKTIMVKLIYAKKMKMIGPKTSSVAQLLKSYPHTVQIKEYRTWHRYIDP